MVTIKELAVECGVSVATVSNVLNGTGRVGEKTAEKVRKIAKDLGYVPNLTAKNLKLQTKRTIGIIAEDLTVFNCPEIVDGINEYLDSYGYSFLLGNLRLYQKYNDEFCQNENYYIDVQQEFELMKSKQVCGIIYIGAHAREVNCIPENFGIPIIIAYSTALKQGMESVVSDDEQGAYSAMKKLLELGNRKIGIILGDMKNSSCSKRRMEGVQRALEEYDITLNPDCIAEGDWGSHSGYIAAKKIMSHDITAIFSMNDIMATGVYDYCSEIGKVIGKDIDLIGYDDRDIASIFRPSLTTMKVPLREIGYKSAELLISNIENERSGEKKLHCIPCSMIERNSTTNK